MSDTSAHEASQAQLELERLGFDTSDVCMLPDCGCDGTPHGACPVEVILASGFVPCMLQKGHAGPHQYGETLIPFDCDDDSPGLW